MTRVPRTADEIPLGQAQYVRNACLYIASVLGELMSEVRVVGGIVPSLIVRQDDSSDGFLQHAGTIDLDLGISLALADPSRSFDFIEPLRTAGFSQDTSGTTGRTTSRWRIDGPNGQRATVDFLVPAGPDDRPNAVMLGDGVSAFATPGLSLAFLDFEVVSIEGNTPFGDHAAENIWVCGPGAFIVLKALAFGSRRFPKDAYDLYYVLRYFGRGVGDVTPRFAPLLGDHSGRKAVDILARDFTEPDDDGPRLVAEFLGDESSQDVRADVVGQIRSLLSQVGAI